MTAPTPKVEILRLGDHEYAIDQLSADGRIALERYQQIEAHLQHLRNMQAVLTKARNAYIADLKQHVLKGRTGLDFSDLLSDD